jgi:hypothetical protein
MSPPTAASVIASSRNWISMNWLGAPKALAISRQLPHKVGQEYLCVREPGEVIGQAFWAPLLDISSHPWRKHAVRVEPYAGKPAAPASPIQYLRLHDCRTLSSHRRRSAPK